MSQPHHLMLIDADAAEAYAWARVLGRHGFRVSVVTDGPAAIARQASDPAKAVIVDVLTADLSALAATLRRQTPGLIIVAIAGPQETGTADLTLLKPLDANDLVANLRPLLERSAVATGATGGTPGNP